MKFIIDRFEGDHALVELQDMSIININRQLLPPGVKEGDVISISLDSIETEKRKKKINNLMDELFED